MLVSWLWNTVAEDNYKQCNFVLISMAIGTTQICEIGIRLCLKCSGKYRRQGTQLTT